MTSKMRLVSGLGMCLIMQTNSVIAQDAKTPAAKAPVAKSKTISIQSASTQDLYLGCKDGKVSMMKVKTDVDKKAVSFKVTKPLDNSCGDCISLESISYPGKYLMDKSYVLVLGVPSQDDEKKGATFKKAKGLSGNGFSYESDLVPNAFFFDAGNAVGVKMKNENEFFLKGASFLEVPALNTQK